MSDPTWMSYVGAGTGVLGALTGILGAWMGYKGYRRSLDIQSLDLRLEWHKVRNELTLCLEQLPALLEKSRESGLRSLNAQGLGNSGQAQRWNESCDTDAMTLSTLHNQSQVLPSDPHDLKADTLEAAIATVHLLKMRAEFLLKRHVDSMAIDEENCRRRQLTAQYARP